MLFFLLPFGCKTCIFTNAYMCGLTVARTNVFKNNRTHTDAQSCAYRIHTFEKPNEKKNRQFSIQFVMHKSKRYGCGRSHSLSFRPICNIWAMGMCVARLLWAPDECAPQIMANWKKLVESSKLY